MLTPLPSLGAGAPASPTGEPNAPTTSGAQAAGGESREGNSTNTQQNAWTRLFQSLLTNNLDSGDPNAIGGGASARKKAKVGNGTIAPAPNTPVLQAPVAALPIVQGPVMAVPVVQPISGSPGDHTAAGATAAPQPIAGPWANTAATRQPVLPAVAALPALTESVQKPAISDAPASPPIPEQEAPVAPVSATTITSELANAPAPPQISADSQSSQAIASVQNEQTVAAMPLPSAATQLSAQAQVLQTTTAPQAPAIESFAATVEQAMPQPGLKPANYSAPATNAANNPAPASAGQSGKGFAEASATTSVFDRIANAAMSVSQTQAAAPTSAAAATISQIAQDDRTPGLVSAAQTTRQGGRPLVPETITPPIQTAPATPSTPKVAAQAPPADLQADPANHTRDNAATGQNGVKTSASVSAQTQASVATTSPAPAQTANAANTQLVQGSSQAERIGVINQIANQVVGVPANGASSTVNIQLHPAHWGPVNVSITTTPAQASAANPDAKSVVAATIVSADPAVRDALKAHVQDLSNALTSAGFRVDKLEVAAQATTATSAGQNSSAFHQGQNGGSGSSGYFPNPNGLSAQTGGDNRQNQSFSAAFGQSQGGQSGGGNSPASQNISMQQEGDDQAAPAAPVLRRGLVDYRI
jgi:hypothetical protein